jgi:DNA-binding beta-propeller fold protein YncE
MDYLAYDAAHHRVWVPAGNTGKVDVLDVTTGEVTPIGGFATHASPRPGRPDMGPSSATVADGAIWVGNRGDNKLCPLDPVTLKKGLCIQLPTMPDGLAYAAITKELWVTTPRDNTITIADATAGKLVATIKTGGAPEGYAVDQVGGVFYTNLEDKDKTLAIDIRMRKVLSTWATGCGKEGPRGLALDAQRHLLVAACTNGAVVLDLAHDGKIVGRLKTGGGVDNLDYFAPRHLLYVASAKDGNLTFASLADSGALTTTASAPTASGARNPVVDEKGVAYVADALGGRLIVVEPPVAP